MKDFFLGLGIMLLVGGLGIYFVDESIPEWKYEINDALKTFAKELKIEEKLGITDWKESQSKLDKLPDFYPFSNLKASIFEVPKIFKVIDDLKEIKLPEDNLESAEIEMKELLKIFDLIEEIDLSLKKIEEKVSGIWSFLLTEKQEKIRDEKVKEIKKIREKLKGIKDFENIFNEFVKNEERILIILQNENEPRSTGGFMGSFIFVDFSEKKLSWNFHDIYSLDRNIPDRIKIPAPEFFHGLSKNISLRDANIYPDFPTSAERIREFISYTEEKSPDTIIAINTSIIKELLKISGPIRLDRWGLILDQYNFDLVLEFLVESKIAGRYNVKSPLIVFVQELISNLQSEIKKDFSLLKKIDIDEFVAGKNILANSRNKGLQNLFSQWKLDGVLAQKREANDFLQFDFVSIGANKSEKFVWTKINHDSKIGIDGKVKNTLKIVRNHSLRNGEIRELLDTNLWSDNIKDLLNEELLWKLGAGQNRTMLRITVPNSAKLLSQDNPSGEIFQRKSESGDFQVFDVPMYVLPGEKLNIKLEYEIDISEGSHNWRPYFLEMIGTPARQKTSFLKTISTKDKGTFAAETYNIGKPVNLIDQDFRAVIKF